MSRGVRRRRSRRSHDRRRLGVLVAGFFVLFGLVTARLVELQTINRDRYVDFGESQRVASQTLPAGRGAIFDRNGRELALSVPQRTVVANPRLIADPRAAAAELAALLGAEPLEVLPSLSGDGFFSFVARAVSDEVADSVAELEINGISFIEEPRRFTPAGEVARSLLGGVNIDNVGYSGLEAKWDDTLVGEPGQLIVERDRDGRTIPAGEQVHEAPVPGDDLVLTIDQAMQYEAEQALIEQVADTGAEGGMAIITRPRTGEILAMANVTAGTDGEAPRPSGNNAALTTVFEPGSVNKVITVAAALEEGLVKPDTELIVPDRLALPGHVFTDAHPHPAESWSVTDIITTSSNIGTIKLALEVGSAGIDGYLRRFGFGERTALDFPNEAPGIMLPLDEWSGPSIGSIPLGQGISVTAMQMLNAYNVIANDGVQVDPQLVAATIDADGVEHPLPPPKRTEVVSERTARQVAAMLANVVDEGTGTDAAIPGYTVAGKTGTARKPQPEGGYRDAGGNYHYVATFAGFVPAEDPELSVIVVLDDPTSSYYAGTVSAPLFARLAQYALRRFEIPPATTELRSDVPAVSPDAEAVAANDVPADVLRHGPAGTDGTDGVDGDDSDGGEDAEDEAVTGDVITGDEDAPTSGGG
ncbi:penicillin-binding protein [soil metagenome]